jgi:hypothetical protein
MVSVYGFGYDPIPLVIHEEIPNTLYGLTLPVEFDLP